MTQEQRLAEITRLRNFRAGLEKQVAHFLELERELMSEYILATSLYKIGDAVIAKIKPDYHYNEPVPFICKITNIEPDFYKPYDKEKNKHLPETVRLRYTVRSG